MTHSGQGTPSMVVLPKMDDLNLLRQLKLKDSLPKKNPPKISLVLQKYPDHKRQMLGGAAGSSLVRVNQWLGFGAFLRVCVLAAQLCPTLHNSMNCSPPGSSVHGILQARMLEWVAISFSNTCMHAKSLQCVCLSHPIFLKRSVFVAKQFSQCVHNVEGTKYSFHSELRLSLLVLSHGASNKHKISLSLSPSHTHSLLGLPEILIGCSLH